jgi:hypothetical protein
MVIYLGIYKLQVMVHQSSAARRRIKDTKKKELRKKERKLILSNIVIAANIPKHSFADERDNSL